MAGPSIEDLIRQATAGDVAALERLLHHFQGRLLAYVTRLMPADLRTFLSPQDVIHDTCFEAFRRISEFKATDSDSADRWLATIARHRVTDLVRRQRRLKRGGGHQAIDNNPNDDDSNVQRILEQLAVYQRTPSRSAMRHELVAALEQSIGRLPIPLREAVRLRHLSGLSFKEVALKMSRTERAAQQLCTRAMKQLRLELRSASIFI
jgi:RNA polymerase sigma-70 factor (subfamily 1)